MLKITQNISIKSSEIDISAIRAQGAGGQNVNKVSTAIHLRFDINKSSLPEIYKNRLMALGDYRISKSGIIIIKAQRYRSQDQNKEDALERLRTLIIKSTTASKPRKPPKKPSKKTKRKREADKRYRGQVKKNRRKKIDDFD